MTQPRQSQPPYLVIAREIAQMISDGELRPGDQVFSMAAISARWGVSRGTSRRVLARLRDWDLIEITPGWGSFVKAPERE